MSVRLIPLREEHAPAMLAWLRDPEVRGWLGLRAEPSLEATLAFIAAQRTDTTMTGRAIYEGETHVGTITLDHIEWTARRCRLHVYLGPASSRGRGVGRRAVAEALRIAFDDLDLEEVWLSVHPTNARAIRAYTAAGFACDTSRAGGPTPDELRMTISARHWRELAKPPPQ